MKLVIAEKPSLAKAIRAAVGSEYTVTNARGHIYEQAEPDAYLPDSVPKNAKGKKIWRMQDLPINPGTNWRMLPKSDCKKEISTIKDLLKQADVVINAGDPDREGQLLIDEILVELKYKGPVKRVWLTSLMPDAIKSAFANMKANSEYRPFSDAAMARSHADWLVGMNLTRAWTLKSGNMLSVGRVQTPTLALIVNRDLAIENFKPHDFFEVHALINHANGKFIAKWQPASVEGKGFDSEGRLVDKAIAAAIAAKAGAGTIAEYKSEAKKRYAPLPFSLSALQKKASAALGMGAQEVLDVAQKLYDEQYTSYPRTDCQYLGTDQRQTLASVAANLARGMNVKTVATNHGAFNDAKVTAHTAIVPTGKDASSLSGREAALYNLIAKSVVALFMPPEEYLAASVVVAMGGEKWTATGKQVTSPGWTQLYGGAAADEEDDEKEPTLPSMKKDDQISGKAEVKSLQTKPPKRFTEGTLIDAMTNIHRYIEDPAAKSKLKETSGIGTEATRAGVIETLFKRGWVSKKGKTLISSAEGRAVVAALPKELSDPVTTANWEDKLTDIAAGKGSREEFEKGIVGFVGEQLKLATSSNIASQKPASFLPGMSKTGSGANEAPCPVCDQTARRLESKKKKGAYYWACTNREHALLADDHGKPGAPFGPR